MSLYSGLELEIVTQGVKMGMGCTGYNFFQGARGG